ncbi:MAG: AraC family transcriptional regulator [Labrys sp. (in: a-proteobacteria)]
MAGTSGRVGVDLAVEILTRFNASILEVAFAVGYESSQHFSRIFRRDRLS